MELHKSDIHRIPALPGAYMLTQWGKIVYVGKATNLRQRVSSHYPELENQSLKAIGWEIVTFQVTNSERDASQLEYEWYWLYRPQCNERVPTSPLLNDLLTLLSPKDKAR